MKKNNYNKDLGPDETIPIWFDKLFKLVFANKDHLERTKFLISSVLNLEIDNIELINSEIIEDNRMDKVNTVDLAVELEEATVSIEANSSFGEIIRDRNLAFMFKIQSRSLNSGQDYINLKRSFQINLNQENFDNQPFNVCHMRSDNTGLLYSKKSEIYNINVKHYAEMCYNGHMDELSETEKLFALIGVNKKSVIDKLITDSNVLKEIGIMAKKYSGDKVILESYNREELLKADMQNEFSKKEELLKADMQNEFSKKEELLKANMQNELAAKTEEVAEKTTLDMACRMKKQGINVSDIEIVTGLSKDTDFKVSVMLIFSFY